MLRARCAAYSGLSVRHAPVFAFIPVKQFSESQIISVVNSHQKNISILNNTLNVTPLERAINSGFQSLFIYSIIYAIWMYVFYVNLRDSETRQVNALEKAKTEYQQKAEEMIQGSTRHNDEMMEATESRVAELQQRVQELKSEEKQRDDERKELVKEYESTKYYFSRAKILLLARISDYSKELNFWRDT